MYSPGLKFIFTIKQNNGKYSLKDFVYKIELSRNKYLHERLEIFTTKLLLRLPIWSDLNVRLYL